MNYRYALSTADPAATEGAGANSLASLHYMPLGLFWSLAVEEHFYFLYPLVLRRALRSPRGLLPVIVAGIALVFAWRCILAGVIHPPPNYLQVATDARIDSILYGALLAVLADGPRGQWWVDRLTRPAVLAVAVVVLLVSIAIRNETFRDTARYSAQGLALTALVAGLVFAPRLAGARRVLEHPVLSFIGRISYSLYIWHLFCLTIAGILLAGRPPLLIAIVGLALSVATASASYAWVERPMARLRRRFGSLAR